MLSFKAARIGAITGLAVLFVALTLGVLGLLIDQSYGKIAAWIGLAGIPIAAGSAWLLINLLERAYQDAVQRTGEVLKRVGLDPDIRGLILLPPACEMCGETVEGYTGHFSTDRRGMSWLTQANNPCGHEGFRRLLSTTTPNPTSDTESE